jgi:hypothetical protein
MDPITGMKSLSDFLFSLLVMEGPFPGRRHELAGIMGGDLDISMRRKDQALACRYSNHISYSGVARW